MRTCILGTTVITGPRFSLVHPTLKFVITLNYLDLENTRPALLKRSLVIVSSNSASSRFDSLRSLK